VFLLSFALFASFAVSLAGRYFSPGMYRQFGTRQGGRDQPEAHRQPALPAGREYFSRTNNRQVRDAMGQMSHLIEAALIASVTRTELIPWSLTVHGIPLGFRLLVFAENGLAQCSGSTQTLREVWLDGDSGAAVVSGVAKWDAMADFLCPIRRIFLSRNGARVVKSVFCGGSV
jgi:hypothetical protein